VVYAHGRKDCVRKGTNRLARRGVCEVSGGSAGASGLGRVLSKTTRGKVGDHGDTRPVRVRRGGSHLSTRSNSIALADARSATAIAARARKRVDARIISGVSAGVPGARRSGARLKAPNAVEKTETLTHSSMQ